MEVMIQPNQSVYIQNLNEKITVEGIVELRSLYTRSIALIFHSRIEEISLPRLWPVWQSDRRAGKEDAQNARPSIHCLR